MTAVYISVGSNNEAELHLKKAYQTLKSCCSHLRVSPVYASHAQGFSGGDFYNAVFYCETTLDLDAFGELLKKIETANGRKKPAKRFGVALDLDILLFGDICCQSRPLPRSDIYTYHFVLKPLSDLSPGLILPDTQKSVIDLWNEKKSDFSRYFLQKVDFSLKN